METITIDKSEYENLLKVKENFESLRSKFLDIEEQYDLNEEFLEKLNSKTEKDYLSREESEKLFSKLENV